MRRDRRGPLLPGGVVAIVLLVACSPPGSPSDGSIGQTTGAQTPQTTCPAPTNDVPLDLEMGIPLAYLSGLGIFNVYWGENWDSLPGSLQRADIDKALKDVVATTYFDKLRQYGVPGLHFEGSATTGGFLYPCQGSPGPVTWIDFSSGTSKGGFDITKVLSLFKKGEAADICQDMGLSEVDLTAADGTVFGVAPYWSNADNACVPGQAAAPSDTTAPVTTATGAPPPNGRSTSPRPARSRLLRPRCRRTRSVSSSPSRGSPTSPSTPWTTPGTSRRTSTSPCGSTRRLRW